MDILQNTGHKYFALISYAAHLCPLRLKLLVDSAPLLHASRVFRGRWVVICDFYGWHSTTHVVVFLVKLNS